jgi:hypothetical protein
MASAFSNIWLPSSIRIPVNTDTLLHIFSDNRYTSFSTTSNLLKFSRP